MASLIHRRATVLFASGFVTGYSAMWVLDKGRQYGISRTDGEKSQLALRRPAAGARETAETSDRQGNCNGSSAGFLWAKENCSRSQRFLSPCDLPTHEDFQFECNKFGSVVFTRIHEGIITEIKLSQDDLMHSTFPLYFFVKVKSDENVGNEKRFMCGLNVSTIQENMTEEDICNIVSLKVDGKIVFHEKDMPQIIEGEKLKKKCFKYLKKHGLTQEFFYFLTNTFLPEYKEAYYDEQINHLADIIDDETV